MSTFLLSGNKVFRQFGLKDTCLYTNAEILCTFVMKNLRQAVYYSGKRFSRRKWKPLLSRESISEVKIDLRSSCRNCWLLSDRTSQTNKFHPLKVTRTRTGSRTLSHTHVPLLRKIIDDFPLLSNLSPGCDMKISCSSAGCSNAIRASLLTLPIH